MKKLTDKLLEQFAEVRWLVLMMNARCCVGVDGRVCVYAGAWSMCAVRVFLSMTACRVDVDIRRL
jgi:hypothetical protein